MLINWIKKKIHWILVATGIVGVVLAGGMALTQSELSKIQNIQQTQDAYFQQHGKYEQIKKTNKLISNKNVEVFTLKAPDGQQGYMIRMYWKVNDKTYMKSIGYGVDAEHHTFEKIIKIDKPATTTP